MSKRESTNAELIAAAVTIALAARALIEWSDRTSYRDTCEALDGLREGMVVAGGTPMHLAERLKLTAEFDRLVKQERDRVDAFRACQGLGGRA